MLPPFAAERSKPFIAESQLIFHACYAMVLFIISVEIIAEIILPLDNFNFVWLQVGF